MTGTIPPTLRTRGPSKSWGVTILFAILAAVTPFINEPLEKYLDITITEAELQHLITGFLGSGALGGLNAAHKRHEAHKAGGATATINTAPTSSTTHASTTPFTAPSAPRQARGIVHPETGEIVPGTETLDDDDEYDDDDDDVPPPKRR